jgi:hypothetical protein
MQQARKARYDVGLSLRKCSIGGCPCGVVLRRAEVSADCISPWPALKFAIWAARRSLQPKELSMEPSVQQPDRLDASKPSGNAFLSSATGEPVSEVASEANEFAQDWRYAQKALVARWRDLTPDDFAASDGDRERFVERLAGRIGISQFEAANDLTAFEAHQPVHWRKPVRLPLSKQ